MWVRQNPAIGEGWRLRREPQTNRSFTGNSRGETVQPAEMHAMSGLAEALYPTYNCDIPSPCLHQVSRSPTLRLCHRPSRAGTIRIRHSCRRYTLRSVGGTKRHARPWRIERDIRRIRRLCNGFGRRNLASNELLVVLNAQQYVSGLAAFGDEHRAGPGCLLRAAGILLSRYLVEPISCELTAGHRGGRYGGSPKQLNAKLPQLTCLDYSTTDRTPPSVFNSRNRRI
jgi:hypothetical protein